MTRTAIVALLLLLSTASADAQGPQPNTTWQNDKGSEFTIVSVGPDGSLKGTFTNQAAGFGCKNTPYPVMGWIDGERIAFSVRWKNAQEDCKSITSWTGYVSGIRMLAYWDLVYVDATEKHPLVIRGTDYFKKK